MQALQDPAFRNAARALQSELAGRQSLDEAVDLLERAARQKPRP
jgi:hypothetical protein